MLHGGLERYCAVWRQHLLTVWMEVRLIRLIRRAKALVGPLLSYRV